MADEGVSSGPAGVRGRAPAGIRTWPVRGAQWGWPGIWPQFGFAVPARVRAWAAAEIGAGRLFPWLAVAFGSGIVLYFAADHEPAAWAACAAAAVGAIAAILLRRRPLAFALALGFFGIALGFAVATLKATLIAHPVLRFPAYRADMRLAVRKMPVNAAFLGGAASPAGDREVVGKRQEGREAGD